MIQRNTYSHVYQTWRKVNRVQTGPSPEPRLRATVTRSFFAGESGAVDSPSAKLASIIGKKRTIKNVDSSGILLTTGHWYPFFVLTLLKPLNKKKVDV